jgi:hypothetical protein
MSILNQIPTPSFEFNAGLVDNRGALALVRQGQDITGQSAFPFVRNGVKNVPDKLGILRAVPANEPAVTFDGQGRNLGYLPESSRTNLLLRSEEFDNAYWTGSLTALPAQIIAPNGTLTGSLLYRNGAAGGGLNLRAATWPSNTGTRSIYVKKQPGSLANLFGLYNSTDNNRGATIDLSTGIATAQDVNYTASSVHIGNGWYRFSVTTATTFGTVGWILFDTLPITLNNVGINNGIFIWGAQLEVGSFASSYIPTTDTALTRPADILTFTNASDLIGQSEGVMYVEANISRVHDLIKVIFGIGSSAEGISLLDSTSGGSLFSRLAVRVSTALGDNYSAINDVNYSIGLNKFLIKYSIGATNSYQLYNNGTQKGNVSGLLTFANPLDRITIGGGATVELNDPIRSVRLWKTADWCDDATAQLLTRI